MKRNISPIDRLIRLLIALILFGLAVWKSILLEALGSRRIVHQLLSANNCKK